MKVLRFIVTAAALVAAHQAATKGPALYKERQAARERFEDEKIKPLDDEAQRFAFRLRHVLGGVVPAEPLRRYELSPFHAKARYGWEPPAAADFMIAYDVSRIGNINDIKSGQPLQLQHRLIMELRGEPPGKAAEALFIKAAAAYGFTPAIMRECRQKQKAKTVTGGKEYHCAEQRGASPKITLTLAASDPI